MHKSSIIYSIIFYVLLAVLIVIVAHGMLADAEKIALREFGSEKLTIAYETMHGIESAVSSVKDNIEYLATFPQIANLDESASRSIMKGLFNSINSIVASITRVDSSGIIRITVPYSDFEGYDINYQEHIKRLLKNHQPVIGGPLKIVQGFDAFVIHIPTFKDDSIFTGSIAGVIAFDTLKSRFIEPLLGDTNEIVWLANAGGKVLCHQKYKFGKQIEEIYSDVNDRRLLNFLVDFPIKDSGWLTYKDSRGRERILYWYCKRIGFEKWVLGIDVKEEAALASLIPLKKKIIISSILALLLAVLGVFAVARLTERKSVIEQQRQCLKIADYRREKLEYILQFARSLLTDDMSIDPYLKILEGAKSLLDAPIAMEWKFLNANGELIPEHSIIGDYRIAEELRSAGIDIAQVPLPVVIGNIDLSKLSGYVAISVDVFSDISAQWKVIVNTLKSICPTENFTVIPFSVKDRYFACVVVPENKESIIGSEFIESFRISVSQSLYIRSILSELIANNRINQDVLKNVDKAIFLVDSHFTVLSASPVFYRLYEVKEDAIGKNLFEVVPFLKNLHLEEIFRDVIRTRMSRETEETYLSSEKKRRFTRTKIIPIITDGERVERLLVIVDDVTEFRLLEEELKHTADELAQKNHQLAKLAITDELTQLKNYRYFIEQLPNYILQHRKKGIEMSLLSMDIDDFKRYNDTYGHPAGDRLLAEVADIIRGFLRSEDLGVRYGGDEFVIILSKTDRIEAQDVAERLCSRIARTSFLGEKGIRNEHITVSIGIAILTEDIANAEELLRQADSALYESKRNGKNRITIYDASGENPKNRKNIR
ncbi:diguanylate cyclase [bacterium]|nr:diguanylate cyclase [bacterium]